MRRNTKPADGHDRKRANTAGGPVRAGEPPRETVSPRGERTRAPDSDGVRRLPLASPTARFQPSTFTFPTEIGCFSFGPDRVAQQQSRAELKYYCEPDPGCNLSDGFPDRFIQRAPTAEHLDALLECLDDVNATRRDLAKEPIRPALCTWRGIMTKIMCTPYSTRDEWQLNATLFKGTVFLEEREEPEAAAAKYGRSDRDRLFTYWGYKFESLATVPVPPSQLQPDDPVLRERSAQVVDTNVQFCSVFRATLGKHDMVLGGEVDCLIREPRPDERVQNAYAELKTNRVITDPRQQNSFEKFKLLRVWAQSYLAGVPNIIFGFRTDDGRLSHTKRFETAELPRLVRGKPGMWDPNRCIAFAAECLTFIRDAVTVDDRRTVYLVRFNPSALAVEIHPAETDSPRAFLPGFWEG